ncbi:thiolase family protein [Sporosarcina pasteurii]|uniref:acetyl-CoA C-acetyltransferase n=1 Tax=Sporosarcina pasteurii TaxID=1474 RepID=A0A380C414_SPOPA|nr:thiolase family protein [Sporosarcina pasteurii]MDS9471579.1 thiolase family protein [Sporosarcina pasteurii]QBQ04806.1 thiolase family protein [Sporosarcina pasteurii]SUJ11185.1 Acetyl-CoA acetyltransferase [Sporosarcina pasteurii]
MGERVERVVIVQGVRTPIGRYGGTLKELNSGNLAAHVIEEVLKKSYVSPEVVDEVILGEVRQTTESSNVARVAALRAKIPVEKPAFTINRLCASGMQAIASGVQQIQSRQAEVVIAGGTESMSNSPIYLRNSRFGGDKARLVDSNTEAGQQPSEMYGTELGMGMTAENVAEQFDVSREAQDAFSIESQRRAAVAIENGRFNNEIVPIEIKTKKGSYFFDQDEHPRPETTFEKLQQLKTVFKRDGTVTAGNTCGRNDGAAAVLLMTEGKAKDLNLNPMAAVIDWVTVGVDPEIMGIGPVPAIKKLLARTNKTLEEIDLFEINEAFAAQALAVQQELGIDTHKLNVNGGAIALGHPVGATGARIVVTLMHELKRRHERFGIASLCVGGGQGMAILIENLQND